MHNLSVIIMIIILVLSHKPGDSKSVNGLHNRQLKIGAADIPCSAKKEKVGSLCDFGTVAASKFGYKTMVPKWSRTIYLTVF